MATWSECTSSFSHSSPGWHSWLLTILCRGLICSTSRTRRFLPRGSSCASSLSTWTVFPRGLQGEGAHFPVSDPVARLGLVHDAFVPREEAMVVFHRKGCARSRRQAGTPGITPVSTALTSSGENLVDQRALVPEQDQVVARVEAP